MKKKSLVLLCLPLALAGCPSGGGSTDTAGSPDMAVATGACPPSTGPGVVHRSYVTADETWAAADGPHHVTSDISVLGATLTIEACAVVLLDEGVTITVGANSGAPARLLALGSPAASDLR